MESAFFSVGKYVRGSFFTSLEGAQEFFFTINSKEEPSFSHELKMLYDTYMMTMEKFGLSEDTQIFCRIYINDIAKQKNILLKSKIFDIARKGAVSIIQECSIKCGSISLIVYHI